jgi:ABC-2 type transport system permease protein
MTPTIWTSTQTRSQFAAIAWLRWRIFLNSFRRKGGGGEIVGRIIIYLVFGSFILMLVAGAGIGAYYFAANGLLEHTSWILWAIFILCQLLNIQLGQPGTTFDPTQLIRFPLGVRTFVVIRPFFGLLTPANILGTLMSFAVFVGVTIALPGLSLYALVGLAIFAAANVLFSRMVFAWVDRWLSTRRAREIFTGLIFAFSLGIQWANFTFNPAYNHHHTHGVSHQRLQFAQGIYQHAHPLLAYLPPELITSSLLAAHRSAIPAYLGDTLGCAVFAGIFFAVFAMRMRIEYRGENISDAANAIAPAAKKTPPLPHRAPAGGIALAAPAPVSRLGFLPPTIAAMLPKEFLYLRRNTGVLYGLVMPIFLVLILASKFASRGNALWVFPAAVAYTLLAVGPLSYNSFGLEATGAQLYFLAPVHLRDILLAKNLFSFVLAFVEIFLVFIIICYVAGAPSLPIALSAMLWAAGTLAVNTIFGNRRSITTPKKINPQRMANKQASPVSGFISLGIMMASSTIAALLFAITFFTHTQWLLLPLFALFAGAGIFAYLRSLRGVDSFALSHREELFAELCKQA